MKRWFKLRIAIAVMVGLYLGWYTGGKVATAQSQTDPLLGKWQVEVIPDDDGKRAGGKKFEDVLEFKNADVVTSTELKKMEFKENGKYETDSRRYGPAKFWATFEDKKQGKAKWEGIATGQNVEGTLTWTKKDGAVVTYGFKGERKVEKK